MPLLALLLAALPAVAQGPGPARVQRIRSIALETLAVPDVRRQIARVAGTYHSREDGATLVEQLDRGVHRISVEFDENLPPKQLARMVQERDDDLRALPPKVFLNGRPEQASSPAAQASALVHETAHALGLGEWAAHRIQLIFWDHAKKAHPPEPGEPDAMGSRLATMERHQKAGTLLPRLRQRYGRKFREYPDDRLAAARMDLRSARIRFRETGSGADSLRLRWAKLRRAWAGWRVRSPAAKREAARWREDGHRLREELRDAARRYVADKSRMWHRHESSRSPEADLIPPGKPSDKKHLIYFGAGMDVVRGMIVQPGAKHIHLVDPALVYYEDANGEITARLRKLAPDASVEVVKPGYSAKLDRAALERLKGRASASFSELHAVMPASEAAADEPQVLRVRWTSPSAGRQERLIHLHPLSYRDPYIEDPDRAGADLLLRLVPKEERLVGVMAHGAPTPVLESLRALYGRMVSGGFFAKTVYHHPSKKGRPDPGESAEDFIGDPELFRAASRRWEGPEELGGSESAAPQTTLVSFKR